MKKTIRFTVLMPVVFSACMSGNIDNACLLPDTSIESAQKVSRLSDIFKDYRIVRLETTDSCLIGDRMSKIIKRDSIYYIKNFDEIILFHSNGQYLKKLSKRGGGPDEYTEIIDFDIVSGKDGDEIWIGSGNSILRYDASGMMSLGHIGLESSPNRLHYVNDSTIITSGPGDKWLSVCGYDGKVRKQFFDEDQANGMYKIMQFDNIDGKITYHVDDTNEAAVYDPATESYSFMKIFPDLKGVTDMQTNRDYYKKFGYLDFLGEVAKDFDALVYFRTGGNNLLAQVRKPSKECMLIASDGKTTKLIEYDMMKDSAVNDITGYDDLTFLSTPIATRSDNGFLFILESSKAEGGNEDSNPILLDVTSLSL